MAPIGGGGDSNCEIVSLQIAVFIYVHDGKEGCEMMCLIEMKFPSVCFSAVTMVATQPDTRVQVYLGFLCVINNKQQNHFHPLIQPTVLKKKNLWQTLFENN